MKKTALALFASSLIMQNALGNQPVNDPLIFSHTSTKDLFQPLDLSQTFAEKGAFNLQSGSLTLRVKNLANTNSGLTSLFGVSNPNSNEQYINFFINKTKTHDVLSIEFRDHRNNVPRHQDLAISLPPSQTDFRTITYTVDQQNNHIKIYVDGKLLKTLTQAKFFGDIKGLTAAYLGKTDRHSLNEWRNTDNFYHAELTKDVLTDEQVLAKHQSLITQQAADLANDQTRRLDFGAEKSEATPLFQANQQGARNYRIPSLITTKDNVVIAAIDKRYKHSADWGNIDTVIRRSLDGGKTWLEDQVVIDLAEQPSYGNVDSAFLIDPLMVQDKNTGRIFMMVDMFPETQGFFGINRNHTSEGTGYKHIDGKSYRLLAANDGSQYTVRENGIVFDENNQVTDYRVVIQGDPSRAFKDLGDLYKGEERLGNIFLQANGTNNDTAPLKVKITSYLWMTYSDDNGATWSNPVDLNAQVKADWMRFLGVGPGNGIQLKNGNLIMPIYYTNSNNKQSAAVLISKDGGQTWERGESPNDRFLADHGGSRYLNNDGYQITESQVIELNNGELKMFSRNLNGNVQISTSKNGGYTWLPERQFDSVLADPYSQMSVLKYSKLINGKEYVIFANPHSSTRSRVNGKVWLGEIQEDGSIEWKYNTTISTGSYAYNSLTELPNGDIGLLYEESAEKIQYVSLNLQELLWRDNLLHNDIRKAPRNFALNGITNETFYKIGDGEMVKVGEGENLANLVIQEGGFTLNQQADSNGAKKAFQTVTVENNGTIRLASADQIPLDKLYLRSGILDLNGQNITLSHTNQLKHAESASNNEIIYGNIVNDNSHMESTLTYGIDGNDQYIVGNLGNHKGKLNLTYQPTNPVSNLTINGHTILNVIDVKSGVLSYVPETQHSAQQLILGENASLNVGNSTTTTISQSQLSGSRSAIFLWASSNATTTFSTNTQGQGTIEKHGDSLLKLNGNLNHHGQTIVREGKVEFNGQLNNNQLILESNTTLGGNANINGDSFWKQGSLIAPGFNQDTQNFGAQVIQFANVINEGARVLLRVNNTVENISNWQYDQLIVNGQVQSETPIPVDVQMIGNHQGNSDKNQNGKYDVDEGISLIKVAAESNKLQQFVLNSHNTRARSGNSLFQYALVSVDESIAQRTDPNKKFFDYRLQTRLVDEQGNSPEPVIRSIKKTGSSIATQDKPALSELEIANLVLEQKQQELAEKTAELERAKAEKQAAEQDSQRSTAEKVAAEQKAQQAAAEKATAEQQAQQAAAEKALAEEALRTQQAEKAAEIAKKQQEMANSARQYRAALHHKVPSYLVANTAMLNQGESVHRQFMDNIWSGDKKGLYVNQQNGHSQYTSNLGFTDYGYGYKANQSSTLFGGFAPLSDNTELHAAIGFSKQTVKPQAVDGSSETRYKSTSFLVGLHNKWDNVILNTTFGYHSHRGKVSTSEQKNIGRIDGSQMQFAGEVGYEIPVGQFAVTPMLGLSYQQLKTDVEDTQDRWNIALKPYNVFNQQLGANISWRNDVVRLSAGAFYENSNGHPKAVSIAANGQYAEFATGRHGNALLFKVNSDFTLAKHLTFGLRIEHRHALSTAKLKQTQFGGKLEYRF